MKNTLGDELSLNLGEHYALIQEIIDSDTNLNGTIATWNLKALDSINVIDSINDDKQRKEIEFKRRRKNSVITWAVIGGVVDASSGDDSILDGVLLGGLFGYISSGSVKDPKASILLTFTNGDKLGLIVNQIDLLRIMEVPQDANLIDGKTVRILSSTEQNCVVESRRSKEFFKSMVFGALGIVSIGLFNLMFADDLKEFSHGTLLLNLGNISYMIIFSIFIIYSGGFFGKKPDEEYKKPNEK